MSEHEAAVKSTGQRVRRTAKAASSAIDQHIAAVLAALRAGERPTDVAAWSHFTATYLRRLAREAGIPPAARGGARRRRD